MHLVNVAYNSIFIGEIALPDWDMFTSRHEVAAMHAAVRPSIRFSISTTDLHPGTAVAGTSGRLYR